MSPNQPPPKVFFSPLFANRTDQTCSCACVLLLQPVLLWLTTCGCQVWSPLMHQALVLRPNVLRAGHCCIRLHPRETTAPANACGRVLFCTGPSLGLGNGWTWHRATQPPHRRQPNVRGRPGVRKPACPHHHHHARAPFSLSITYYPPPLLLLLLPPRASFFFLGVPKLFLCRRLWCTVLLRTLMRSSAAAPDGEVLEKEPLDHREHIVSRRRGLRQLRHGWWWADATPAARAVARQRERLHH